MNFAIGSFTNAYSYLLLLIAFIDFEVSVAEPLSMLSVIITIVLSHFLFKEDIRERIFGAIFMFVGAILLIVGI